MMPTYDWVVVGGGLTGAAVSYELAITGFKVLLIEKSPNLLNATSLSYGGIPYWAASSPLTQALANAALVRYQSLAEELTLDFQFRELDLLLTFAGEPPSVLEGSAIAQPQLLAPKVAYELEPLINPTAISGALHFNHAQVHPQLLAQAYQMGLLARGGQISYGEVVKLDHDGVTTSDQTKYGANNVVVCAGGWGRSLLNQAGLYFTQAVVIKTNPTDLNLRTMILPAINSRLTLEADSTQQKWQHPNALITPAAIDLGAVQFSDRTLRLGQQSLVHTNPHYQVNLKQAELEIRNGIAKILPAIAQVPGQCYQCLVAFTPDSLPLVGLVQTNIYLFSGFTSPFLYVPPLAQRFAQFTVPRDLSPTRFGNFNIVG